MVIHSFPLKSCPPLFGKGRDGGHGHTQPSFSKALLSCWEREGVLVMAIQALIFKSSPLLLGKGGGGGDGHTAFSSCKGKGWWSLPYRAFFFKSSPLLRAKGGDGGHDHTAFSSLKRNGVVVIVIRTQPPSDKLSLFWKGREW